MSCQHDVHVWHQGVLLLLPTDHGIVQYEELS